MSNGPPPSPWARLVDMVLEPQFAISLVVMGMFLLLIVLFGVGVLKMNDEAKNTILQSFVVAFTASWSYWLGSSSGSKAKDQKLMEGPLPPAEEKK